MNGILWIVIIGLSVCIGCMASICMFECLSLCVLVVSGSVSVHLLDEHVYVVLSPSKDRVSLMRNFHHGLFALRGSSMALGLTMSQHLYMYSWYIIYCNQRYRAC